LQNQWDETEQNWAEPGPRGEKLRFQDFPAFHLMSLAGLAKHAMMNKHLEPWGLSMPEWRLLTTVAQHSPIRFARIATLTAMDKAQVSRALRTAQGKGFVQTAIMPAERRNSPEGPTVAGRVVVTITQAGREIHDQVMPLAQRDQLRLIELMSADERQMLLQVAHRLFAALQTDQQQRTLGAGKFRSEQAELSAGTLVSSG
jgi:DNA-binding MarR family transcriptional regulator